MDQFFTAVQGILDALATAMLVIVPAVVTLTFVIGGIMLAKSEDGRETKEIKDRMIKALIGAALAGGATAISTWVMGLVGGG